MICENCGKEHNGSYGRGRFCSSFCARSFSSLNNREEKNKKISESCKERYPYSTWDKVIFIHNDEEVPSDYIKGNFFISRVYQEAKKNNTSIEEAFEIFKKQRLSASLKRKSKKDIINENLNFIEKHNQEVLQQYEELLSRKIGNKTDQIKADTIYANYLAKRDKNHLRSKSGRVFIHILLAERLLERPLNLKEVVHHKDENKLNNTFRNIYIFNDKSSHSRFHQNKFYWLTIDKDVLVCSKIEDHLKDLNQ